MITFGLKVSTGMNKSSHILSTSSNLLGLCFIVLTSLKVLKLQESTIIDEITGIAAIGFMSSAILSFLSIRSGNDKATVRYENIAEFFFMTGLIIMFIITMIITFDIMK